MHKLPEIRIALGACLFVVLAVGTTAFARAAAEPNAGPQAAVTEDAVNPSAPSSAQTIPPDHDFARQAWASRRLTERPFSAHVGGGYGIVTGPATDYIHGGASAAAGIAWQPNSAFPLALRLDGTYNWFTPGRRLLGLNGVGYNRGERDVYGADLDVQFGLAATAIQRVYVLGGPGRYRVGTRLQKLSAAPPVCTKRFCGTFPTLLAAESDITSWDPSWNVGVGWEMALDAHTALFLEARYQRIFTRGSTTQFVPIRVGLSF